MEFALIQKENLSEIILKQLITLDHHLEELRWPESEWSQLVIDLPRYFLIVGLDTEKNSAPLVALALFLKIEEEKLAHLLKIVVDPRYRKQGIGERLLKESILLLNRCSIDKIYLEVASKNSMALRLYEKLHFTKLHLCRNFYGFRRDAFKMMLDLSHSGQKGEGKD